MRLSLYEGVNGLEGAANEGGVRGACRVAWAVGTRGPDSSEVLEGRVALRVKEGAAPRGKDVVDGSGRGVEHVGGEEAVVAQVVHHQLEALKVVHALRQPPRQRVRRDNQMRFAQRILNRTVFPVTNRADGDDHIQRRV